MEFYKGDNLNKSRKKGRKSNYEQPDEFMPIVIRSLPFSFDTGDIGTIIVQSWDESNDTAYDADSFFSVPVAKKDSLSRWAQSEGGVFSLVHNGGFIVSSMPLERRQLASKVALDSRTKLIYYFVQNETPYLWVIVEDSNVDTEIEYSSYFLSALGKNPDSFCEFIVFSEQELATLDIPKDAEIIFQRG